MKIFQGDDDNNNEWKYENIVFSMFVYISRLLAHSPKNILHHSN